MNDEVRVRRLVSGDEELAAEAVNRLKLEEDGEPERVDSVYMKTFLADGNSFLIVAMLEDQPVGFVLGYSLRRVDEDRHMFYIHEVGVASTHRKRGIGKLLMEGTKRICQDNEFTKMFLITSKTNLPAMRLYESTDGQPAGSNDLPAVFYWGF